jgi:hypothetical protein
MAKSRNLFSVLGRTTFALRGAPIMTRTATGTLSVRLDNDGNFTDEYGDRWIYVTDDMKGRSAVNREDGCQAGIIREDANGTNDLYRVSDGYTFDVNNADEFIVADGSWKRNES